MIVAEKQVVNSNNTIQNTKRFLIAVFVIGFMLLVMAGCGEKPSTDDELADTEAVVTETAVSPQETVAPETPAMPEIAGEITVSSQVAVNVTPLAEADLAAAAIEPPPADLKLVSAVYALDSDETAVSGQVAINTPVDADVTLLDMVGWDGASWTFIPSKYDAATQQRHSAEHPLFQAVALVQAETEPTQLSETIVNTVYIGADGELAGELADSPAGVAKPYLQLTNVGEEIEVDAVTAVLADEAAQADLLEAVLEIIEPYAGLNLNVQGLNATHKKAFTTFVQALSAALATQDKNLILTLPAPQDTDTASDLAGYDWAALANSADSLYLQLPLAPEAYQEEGAVDHLLAWATDNIDRRKLVALIPTSAVIGSGDTWTPLTAEELVTHFGEVEVDADSAAVEPETAIEAVLSGEISPIQWDEANAAYYYTVEEDEVWLAHPATVAARVETAVKHNLQGIAFTSPVQLSDSAQADAPVFVWTVLDEEGDVIASENTTEAAFTWAGAAEPGEFTLQVDFVSGETTTPLGTLPVTVADTEEDVAAERITMPGIIKKNAFVRVGPGENYDKFPAPILKDTEVEVIGRDKYGYWLQIVFENSAGEQTGWMATPLIAIDPAFDIATLADVTEVIVSAPSSTVASGPANPAPAPSSGPPSPVSAPPVAAGGFELGGQTHSFSNPPLMAASGMNWVKFQHKWGSGSNPNDLAGRINNAHAAGFKVLLSIPGANTYPESIDFEKYVQFLGGVAALGPDAIEVWNEMNIDFEWPAGQIDPASYVNNMLAPAYNAIKSANPNVMVISGAPAPTGFDNGTNAWADNRYMAGVLAAGGGNYADCIGAHYNAGASSPSSSTGHPTGSAHYSWYLLPTLNVYAQLGKPVCFTELGYLSGDDYGGVPERFAWASDTSVEEHAAWLAEAVSVAANTGKVRMIIVFNVDFDYWGSDPQAGYAMIRKNGGCPACETLARVMGR
ncbi:MAG: hypothetical protein IAF02_02350 [Anaerolineae bacterium]|nr:hypothetical protein [Anaerolineae bacterium]